MHHLWKDYLYFSRKERIALIVLFAVVALLFTLPRIFPIPHSTTLLPSPPTSLTQQQTLDNAIQSTNNNSQISDQRSANQQLQSFDPNTASYERLLELGLREKVARTLINYRNKGGRFRYPEDLRKIYGLKPEEADRLVPYVTIPQTHIRHQTSPNQTSINPTSAIGKSANPAKFFSLTNVNTATAEDWRRFPGIGEVLSRRIVAFRHKLGGFQTIEQVQQTYGLPPEVFEKMLPYLRIDTSGRLQNDQ